MKKQYDPRMHSAEHILNQTMDRMFRCGRCFSAHMGKLPADAGDQIRIVSMGHYDACPCIGPHVNSTREIGTFRITTTSFEDGVLRIRYKLTRPKNQIRCPTGQRI